ncbi:MAG: SpoIIE family protein phosphatase [Bacteroidetes bacterium]|nr:SpoIIE family protein phosphatase [Bacteroidota bacterium]MCW5897405.1 SpoIIE family protein phosphatase [Bacteroidota bacterium]
MATARRTSRSSASSSYESYFEHTALFEFSKVINSSLDPRFIYSHILLTIMGKILSSKGMVIVEKESRHFNVVMAKGFSQDVVGTSMHIRQIPPSIFLVDKVNATKYPWVKFFKRLGVKILLPMYMADTPIGLLAFGERFSKKKLHSREVTYLRSLANISATAIEKSRTFDELQQVNRKLDRKIQELNTLFDLSKEFGSLLDAEKLIRLLEFSLLGQVGVNRYIICLRQGSDVRVAASRVDGPVPQAELLQTLFKLKATVPVAHLSASGVQNARDVLTGLRMALVVPMGLQGENKGLMILGERLSGNPYEEIDYEFLTSLANLAIISLENARLFKEAIEKQRMEDELLIARDIQKGLLPNVLPAIPGFDIAAANISSKQVGGDYYDVIPADNNRHVIAIGDVSGKGTPAALLMASIQASIRALVPLNLSLSELTGRVNDLMCENTGGNKFVTFFWGFVDPVAMTLNYVNAGHNYPYLIHADGSIDRLDKGGMILGVLKTLMPYEEATVRLTHGDLLLLFTDGVSEAMSHDSMEYGEERIEAVLRKYGREPAQRIIELLHEDIIQHADGAQQSDDITMMVLKVA